MCVYMYRASTLDLKNFLSIKPILFYFLVRKLINNTMYKRERRNVYNRIFLYFIKANEV